MEPHDAMGPVLQWNGTTHSVLLARSVNGEFGPDHVDSPLRTGVGRSIPGTERFTPWNHVREVWASGFRVHRGSS